MVLINVIQILIEASVSKKWRARSDAAYCGVCLVLHCLPMSHKRTLGLNGLNLHCKYRIAQIIYLMFIRRGNQI